MKRDHFESMVMDEFDKICDIVEQQDAELWKAQTNTDAYLSHLRAIGKLYCDVCQGKSQAADPPAESMSLAYALELHMKIDHEGNWEPEQPKPTYSGEDWRQLAEILASSGGWRIIEPPRDRYPGTKMVEHLNNGRGISIGDVIDDDGNVVFSAEKQVAMFKEVTGWRPQENIYAPPM